MDETTTKRFHAAIDLFNRGDYFDCQEPLEEVYRASEAGEQPVVRAVIMLAVAMHLHFKRGGGRGVLNMLRQSLVVLDDHRDDALGLDVNELYEALEAYLHDLEDRRKPGAGFFDRWLAPRIRYRATAS